MAIQQQLKILLPAQPSITPVITFLSGAMPDSIDRKTSETDLSTEQHQAQDRKCGIHGFQFLLGLIMRLSSAVMTVCAIARAQATMRVELMSSSNTTIEIH